MPSDHVILNEKQFVEAVGKAAAIAAQGRLALFGINPDSAHTGYGYIKRGAPLDADAGSGAYTVARFAEKPDAATADDYVKSGDYFWNSGIFVLEARTFLKELERFEPKILAAAKAALEGAANDFEFLRLDRDAFAAAPSISVDYAVMERTEKAAMISVDMGWNDVGSWTALWDVAPHDDHGNYVQGDALLRDTEDCYVHSERSLVATLGVDNLVIVDTPDAVLVANKSRAQDVGQIVSELKRSNRKEQEQHLKNFRPWGYFETLFIGSRFQVKKLHVKPAASCRCRCTITARSTGWSCRAPQGPSSATSTSSSARTRASTFLRRVAPTGEPRQGSAGADRGPIGTYLGEDDIVRTDDVYRRALDETK
jgi:mannose-1-phosphate guanylyltransferase/mannose-6-phosphate isomerase